MADNYSAFNKPYNGYIGEAPDKEIHTFMKIDDRVYEIKNAVVYKFTLGDVDDPDLYAAQPLWEWQKSDAGQWVMTHAMEAPMWHRQQDAMQWGYNYAVTAKLKDVDLTYFLLKWDPKGTLK